MPLLVRKKLVSADCACASGAARTDIAASAKHADEMSLKPFIEILPIVFLVRRHQPTATAIIPAHRRRKEERKSKRRRGMNRSAFGCSSGNNQLVCCSAESSQVAPRGRTKVQTSVISAGTSLPSTRRPLARSSVLSTSENRIATLA